MYQVKNGILYKDGRPVIGMGAGYYASFHPYKYQVPPEGDRIGEMKKDFADMKKIGFNIVRTSALGEKLWKDDHVEGSFPFPDAMAEEAQALDLAVLMRMNDYSMTMRAPHDEVAQVNEKGEILPHCKSFMDDCVHHPVVIEDNRLGTEYIARHYAQYPAVVMNLIYNEPGYPYAGLHDYHHCAIAAYRRWLVEKGIMTENEAKNYDPPRRRPNPDEDVQSWINWRLFCTESISLYLGDTNRAARKGSPDNECMTCTMPVMLTPGGVCHGEDIFDMAREMDILGITTYVQNFGQGAYFAHLYYDCLASAAKLYGKHIWAAECNAHATLSPGEWERETYAMLGSGFKGLIYYQWRADYDNGKGPEIGAFGILHNNREKTEKFSVIEPMNRLVEKLSPVLAVSEKMHGQVAILFSKHVNAYYDGRENGSPAEFVWGKLDDFTPGENQTSFDRAAILTESIYRELRKLGQAPVFLRAEDLAENKLGARVLIVPAAQGLSVEEKEQIKAFARTGALVFAYQASGRDNGYVLLPDCKPRLTMRPYRKIDKGHRFTMEDVLYLAKADMPYAVKCGIGTLMLNVLENEQGYVAALNNIDSFEREIADGMLTLDKKTFEGIKTARFYTPGREIDLQITEKDGRLEIALPPMTSGCFVVIGK